MEDNPFIKRAVDSTPSSTGLTSHRGTPGTKLTQFSPDDAFADGKSSGTGHAVNVAPSFLFRGLSAGSVTINEVDTQASSGIRDPFTTLQTEKKPVFQKTTSHLSPTAASFEPLQQATQLVDKVQALTCESPAVGLGLDLGLATRESHSTLKENGPTVQPSATIGVLSHVEGASFGPQPDMSLSLDALQLHLQHAATINNASGPFDTVVAKSTRSIVLDNVPTTLTMDSLRAFFNVSVYLNKHVPC